MVSVDTLLFLDASFWYFFYTLQRWLLLDLLISCGRGEIGNLMVGVIIEVRHVAISIPLYE